MGIIDKIRDILTKDDDAIDLKVYKPSEYESLTGGFVSTTTSSVPAVNPSTGTIYTSTSSSTSTIPTYSSSSPSTSTSSVLPTSSLTSLTPSASSIRTIQTQRDLRDKSGRLIGYDTGEQSRLATYEKYLKDQERRFKTGDQSFQKKLTGYSEEEYREAQKLEGNIGRGYDKLNNLATDLERTQQRFESDWKEYIKNGEFVGTESEYKVYKESYEKLNKKIEKYNKEKEKLSGNLSSYNKLGGRLTTSGYLEGPKVNRGGLSIGGKQILRGKQVDLYKFSGLYKDTGSPVVDKLTRTSATIGFLGKAGATVAMETAFKPIEKQKFVIAKEKDISEKTLKGVYQPQFGTATEFDPLTGRAKAKFEDVKVPSRTRPELYFTGEQLGQATGDILGGVGEGSKYLVPGVGGALFLGEVGSSVRESGGVKQYIKEKPGEAALTGAVILTGGAIAGTRYLKSPILKETATGFRVNTRGREIFGSGVRLEKGKVSLLKPKKSLLELERVPIQKPKPKLEASETIGVEVVKEGKGNIYFAGEGFKKATGKEIQKLYQTSLEGERAVVRRLNKKTGKYEILYEGIPQTKLGKEARKKTLEEFKKYGFKEENIKSSLRYSAPRVIEQKLAKGKLDIIGSRASGEFKYLQEQPKLLVDERLGIRTRAARTKAKDIFVKRLNLGNLGFQFKTGIKSVVRKEKNILDITGLEFKGGFIGTKEVGKGTVKQTGLTKETGKEIVKEIPFKTLEGTTIERYIPSLGRDKIFIERGRTTLLKPKVVEETGVKVIQGGGKKSSQEYLRQLYSQELAKAPTVKLEKPKSTIIKIPFPEVGQVKLTQEGLPSMVGGTGVTQLPYSGQGTYEVQGGVSAIQLKGTLQPQFMEMRQQEIQISSPTSKIKSLQTLKPLSNIKTESMLKTVQTPKPESLFKSEQSLRQESLLKSLQKLKPTQLLEIKQLTRQIQKPKTTQVVKQTIKPFVPFKLKTTLDKAIKVVKEKPEVFEAFGFRFGKEKKLGTFQTKKEAEEKLGKFLKGTLGASGFLTKSGAKLKAEETSLLKDVGFRKGKTSEFLVVEEKTKRLRKGTTGKSIQYFRSKPLKSKKRRSLLGI